jgi:hypothetical protein
MTLVPQPSHTHHALYDDPTNDPFDLDEETQERCYAAIYETFRATQVPLSVDELLHSMSGWCFHGGW